MIITSLTQQKQQLRSEVMRARKSIIRDPLMQKQESRQLCMRLLSHPIYHDAPLVLAYCAVPGEADVYMIIEQALRYGKQVAIPRTFSEGQMEFYLLDSASSLALQTEQGAFGILEPLSSLPHIAVEKIPTGTLILVPLVAADHHCRRLGHGKGYYDRFLSRLHKNVHSCGCALSYQIVPHIPIQAHDQPLNYLATPSHLYTCDITS